MSKRPDELATEITVAWLNAFSGQKEHSSTLGRVLTPEAVAEIYRTAFRTINEEWERVHDESR